MEALYYARPNASLNDITLRPVNIDWDLLSMKSFSTRLTIKKYLRFEIIIVEKNKSHHDLNQCLPSAVWYHWEMHWAWRSKALPNWQTFRDIDSGGKPRLTLISEIYMHVYNCSWFSYPFRDYSQFL